MNEDKKEKDTKNDMKKEEEIVEENFIDINEDEIKYGLKEEEIEQIEEELFAQLDEEE